MEIQLSYIRKNAGLTVKGTDKELGELDMDELKDLYNEFEQRFNVTSLSAREKKILDSYPDHKTCTKHGEVMDKAWSKKSRRVYYSHDLDDGSKCFGD